MGNPCGVHLGTLKVPPWGLLWDSLGILGTAWGLFWDYLGTMWWGLLVAYMGQLGIARELLWDYFWSTLGLLGVWGLIVGYVRTTWRLLGDFLGTAWGRVWGISFLFWFSS